MIFHERVDSPLGTLFLSLDDDSIKGLRFLGQNHFPTDLIERKEEELSFSARSLFQEAKAWLNAYFSGQKPSPFDLPLAPEGSEFQKQVWALLRRIPYGETTTYRALAYETATLTNKEKMSAQAIGGAVGRNPIGIILPCHRVIGSDRSLIGYAGGLDKKRFLLRLEGNTIAPDGKVTS